MMRMRVRSPALPRPEGLRRRYECKATSRKSCTRAKNTAVPATPAKRKEMSAAAGIQHERTPKPTQRLGRVLLLLPVLGALVDTTREDTRARDYDGVGGDKPPMHARHGRAAEQAPALFERRPLGDVRLEVGYTDAVVLPYDQEACAWGVRGVERAPKGQQRTSAENRRRRYGAARQWQCAATVRRRHGNASHLRYAQSTRVKYPSAENTR